MTVAVALASLIPVAGATAADAAAPATPLTAQATMLGRHKVKHHRWHHYRTYRYKHFRTYRYKHYRTAKTTRSVRGASSSVMRAKGYVSATWGIRTFHIMRPGDLKSDHSRGKAIDISLPGHANPTGDSIARWATANARALNIKYVIWKQRIWMPKTHTWKLMPNRGSESANHYNHVHLSFN